MRFVFGLVLAFGTVSHVHGKCSTSSFADANGSNNATYVTVLTEGTVVRFSCDQGYKIIGMHLLRCGKDGKWSTPPPSCEIVNCGGIGDIKNGEFVREDGSGPENVYGTKVRAKCDNNTVLNGSVTLTCSAVGSWGNKPVCVESECGNHPGLNTNCTERTEILRNGSLVYHCKNSSESMFVTKVGNGILSCKDTWTPSESGCICSDPINPPPDRGLFILIDCIIALVCIFAIIIYHAIDNREKVKAKILCRPTKDE